MVTSNVLLSLALGCQTIPNCGAVLDNTFTVVAIVIVDLRFQQNPFMDSCVTHRNTDSGVYRVAPQLKIDTQTDTLTQLKTRT